jgi:flavin-dependent dehydrogenase
MSPDLASRTVILEKARHPRPKLCGGGVLPDGEMVLADLGLDVAEVPSMEAVFSCFVFEDRGACLRGTAPYAFRVFRRDEFDAWLARKAMERGLDLREEIPVIGVVPGDPYVEIITARGTYRARVVVAADGAHSRIRRVIEDRRRSHYIYALSTVTPPLPDGSSHRPEQAYFDFTAISRGIPGYIWDFPTQVEGQPMRSWGIYDSNTGSRDPRRKQELLAAEMARQGYRLEEFPLQGESVYAFSPRNVFSAPHILLVGDALGVEKMFGEGVSPAIGCGRIAVEAIVDAFAKGDFSFKDYRRRVLTSEVGKALTARVFLAEVLYRVRNPVVQRFVWWRMGRLMKWGVQHILANWAERGRKAQGKPHREG